MTPEEKQRYREAAEKMIALGLVKPEPPGTYKSGEQSVPRHLAHMRRAPARKGTPMWPKFQVIGLPPSRA